jgi:hypothetical protein
MKRRRNSGGKVAMALQVAIQSLRPCEIASITESAARKRSPDAPISEFCGAAKLNAMVGMPAAFPVALATILLRQAGR